MKYDDDESGEERYYVEWRGRHVCCGMVGGWGGVKRREEGGREWGAWNGRE